MSELPGDFGAESQIDMNANVPLVLDGLAISLGRCFAEATAAA